MLGPRAMWEYIEEFSRQGEFPIEPILARDAHREKLAIESYLSCQGDAWLAAVAAAENSMPPMSPRTRCVVLVPSRYEEQRIVGFLEALAKETVGLCAVEPASIDLMVLENWHEGETRDGTADVVRDWLRLRKPAFRVHLLTHEWARDDTCPVAKARRLLADIALYRAYRRGIYVKPLYLLTEDADTQRTQARRTEVFIDYLDKNPSVDAICGVEERDRAALAKNDLLLLDRRSWFFSETLLSAKSLGPSVRLDADFHWNRVVTPGANICFSAETYALIRGYSTDVCIFEDMDIGQRVSVLRGKWSDGRFVPNVATVRRLPLREESSAARAILALSRGAADPYDGGIDGCSFYDKAVEQTVRNQSPESLLESLRQYAHISEGNKHRFDEVLSMHYREVVRILRDGALGRRVFTRVLWLLGFAPGDYVIQDAQVVLLRVDGFRSLARSFAERINGGRGYIRYHG